MPSSDFNPRSPHGERRARTTPGRNRRIISTHAPRTGSDAELSLTAYPTSHFNPRSPHGERLQQIANLTGIVQFQPTLPARGATMMARQVGRHSRNFNPRSPHGERHALSLSDAGIYYFNPRSPHGERPCPARCPPDSGWYFNPRSPHGERQDMYGAVAPEGAFQPTLPARGATAASSLFSAASSISTHAPRTGSDRRMNSKAVELLLFQPTLPARGATNLLK